MGWKGRTRPVHSITRPQQLLGQSTQHQHRPSGRSSVALLATPPPEAPLRPASAPIPAQRHYGLTPGTVPPVAPTAPASDKTSCPTQRPPQGCCLTTQGPLTLNWWQRSTSIYQNKRCAQKHQVAARDQSGAPDPRIGLPQPHSPSTDSPSIRPEPPARLLRSGPLSCCHALRGGDWSRTKPRCRCLFHLQLQGHKSNRK